MQKLSFAFTDGFYKENGQFKRYYFNFVQVPAMASATADKEPGPAAIGKYVAPLALMWFRWGAVVTWITGAWYLLDHGMLHSAFALSPGAVGIGIGAWLGTIMLFNVWVLIWPNQQKVLGLNMSIFMAS